MLRLIVVTLAALFVILNVFGEETRRVEVARQASDDSNGFTLAAFNVTQVNQNVLSSTDFGISDEDAVRLAMEAGAALRGDRTFKPLYGVVAAVDAAGIAAASSEAASSEDASSKIAGTQEQVSAMWYVTGSTVNLRAGPGTGNAVVGSLGFGAEAEVIDYRDGWYQIRSADGSASGWIFGKFLANTRPG